MKKLRVTVEGKSYEVLVEMLDEVQVAAPVAVVAPVVAAPVAAPAPAPVVVAAPVAAPVAAAPAVKAAPAGPGDVLSPLAGKVVSFEVAVGQVVTEGQQVATIEAMKMNTYIYASRAGTVTAIPVAPGDGVAEGAVLVSIA